MDQTTLIAALIALLFVGAGFMLLSPSESSVSKRTKNIAGDDKAKRASVFNFLRADDSSNRRKQIEESLQEIEQKQKDRKKKLNSLKSKLVQANWSISSEAFTIVSAIIGGFVGLFLYVLTGKLLLTVGAAFVIGFGLPRWFLNFVIARRQKKFLAHFADAMDIIVRGVRTGLPLGDCLKIIAHESPEPLAGEFRLVVEGETLGVPVEVCLERMYERIPVQEVNFFATVLNIQRSSGGNLGESLANLSNVLRGRKMLREKIKALAAEAKVSAIIIGCMPIAVMLLISITSPEYMTELYSTKRGQTNLMIGAGMMVVGTLVMRKMINFKI